MNKLKEKLYEIIERDKEELYEILSSLIKINSENFGKYGNEEEIAEYIASYFNNLGYNSDVYSPLELENIENHPDYLAGRNLENRKNVTVVVPGTEGKRKLMLAAHLDTVEIGDISTWEFPPLCGDIKDGNIYGRGACDDKYGSAICMFLVKKMKENGIKLDYDLIYAGYCDEEYGGSNGALASAIKYPCDDCLSIDCREHELWDCGCGGGQLRFLVSSKDSSDNCTKVLTGLNLLVDRLGAFEKRRTDELNAIPDFKGSVVAARPMRIMSFSVGGKGGVNMDKGEFEVTLYTDKEEKQIDKELNEIFDSLKDEFEKLGLNPPKYEKTTRFFHYVKSNGETPVTKLIEELGKENDYSFTRCGACLSDLPMFKIYGTDRAVALGIGAPFARKGGSHQSNEYVECEKLVKLAKVIAGFIAQY